METRELSIFEFSEPVEYLNAVFAEKKSRNRRFSIRSWSSQLGHANPSLLAQTLKGQRGIGSKLVQQISENLNLSHEEKRFFEVLALFNKAKKPSEKELYLDILNELRPKNKVQSLDLDYFRYISDWYHVAIFEMSALKDFSADADEISDRLNNEITSLMARKAIDRLLRLGLLEQDSNGNIKRTKNEGLVLNYQVPSSAIRKHHKQMIEKSINALENQGIEEREISSTTLSIKKSDIEKIKALMNKYHQEVRELAQDEGADHTYQFNMQLFKLTEGK